MYSTKEIYTEIAPDFNLFRTKIWPCVSRFLSSFPRHSSILEIGCGNGKNMMYKDNPLVFTGIDFCPSLVEICQKKGLTVVESDMTSLPFPNNTFDGFIAVASYHHLDNDISRQQTLNEMYRVLKPGGKGMIVVWAKEQGGKSKFVFNSSIKTSAFGFDEKVIWKSGEKQYERYYHIYEKNDLENEIKYLDPRFKIEDIGWEKGNWYIILNL
jgi:SAM-dependent methyltransferase